MVCRLLLIKRARFNSVLVTEFFPSRRTFNDIRIGFRVSCPCFILCRGVPCPEFNSTLVKKAIDLRFKFRSRQIIFLFKY